MASRRRTSTLKSSSEDLAELRGWLNRLSLAPESEDDVEWLHGRVQAAHCIRQRLLDNSRDGQPKDAFRHVGGFRSLVNAVKDILAHYSSRNVPGTEGSLLLELLQTVFGALAAALHDHGGNRRYFQERVNGDGWSSLRTVLIQGVHQQPANHQGRELLIERVCGCLLACALDDNTVSRVFSQSRQRTSSEKDTSDTLLEASMEKGPPALANETGPGISTIAFTDRDFLDKSLGQTVSVAVPNALHVMFELWKFSKQCDEYKPANPRLTLADIPTVLYLIASASSSNMVALHNTNLLGGVLPLLLEPHNLSRSEFAELHKLAINLLSLGVSKLEDALFLFRHARTSSFIAELLLTSLTSSPIASYVHFDFSMYGFASIELPGIGRTFPPVSANSGYTLSLWFQVVKFDQNLHTTLFGAFDASQTCFVLVYLEKDTHNLILQTSIKSSRPSVRFKAVSFMEGQWYHLALTHRRPRTASSSRASLFVNGEFVEQVRSQYPSLPPTVSRSDGASAIDGARNPVQAFFGTPQDLASRIGKGLVSTKWRLSSAQLFADVLSDDLLAIQYELSPRYIGNFQDCLGSFQSYQASANLNLRNESLNPGKEEKSDIVLAIRSKAGDLIPENKILLNFAAAIIFSDENSSDNDQSQLLQSLSRPSYRNLYHVTRGGRNSLAMNGAYPAINDALLNASGYAVLTGDPTVVVPVPLDDAAWRAGGCAGICLSLIEAARDADELFRSLKIFFGSLCNNWRNSEAIEKEHGFGILANLLTVKLEKLGLLQASQLKTSQEQAARSREHSLRILTVILEFVGYRTDKPNESVINNPLAYRTLLVDLDVWRRSPSTVQKFYYDQFVVFIMHSKYHNFNNKRLSRMRVVRKWLEALKDQYFTRTTFKYFLDSFKVLLSRNFSADAMRSVALYITYSIYMPKQNYADLTKSKSIKFGATATSRRQTVSGNPSGAMPNTYPELSRLQVALGVLEMYTELLCQSGDHSNIKRFARTVTNKWLLYLLADVETSVVVLSAKILSRLLVLSGASYMQKFIEKSGGIVIMRHWLQRLWYQRTVWLICFAILFGRDVATINFSTTFDLFGLLDAFAAEGKCYVVYPEILPVLTAMLRNGLLTLIREQPESGSPSTIEGNAGTTHTVTDSTPLDHPRQRSATVPTQPPSKKPENATSDLVILMHVVTRFLADIHTKSNAFREFAATSTYVQELFAVLFPVVVNANPISPETELQSRDSALTFKGVDVLIKPVSASSACGTPIVRSATPESNRGQDSLNPQGPKRMSSYVLVTSDQNNSKLSTPKLLSVVSPQKYGLGDNARNSIVEELLELALAVFCDQIFARKDFPGLGLFMRVPPGFQEHQAYFETFILRNAISHVGNSIKLDQKLLWEPRVLTNLTRLATHLSEAIFEGWFIDGAEDTVEFLAHILEYLQLPNVSSMKSVRLCSQTISSLRVILSRIVLLRLSELDESESGTILVAFLNKLAYWQTVIFPVQDSQRDFLRLFCYLLYSRLESSAEQVKMAVANMWRLLLVHKSDDISSILQEAGGVQGNQLIRNFKKIMELDNESFLEWFGEQRPSLDDAVFNPLSKHWVGFITDENRRMEETARARVSKRRERLRLWAADEIKADEILRRHETSSEHWRSNIFTAEYLKRQRTLQDQQDGQNFTNASWAKMFQELRRPCGIFDDNKPPKWQLDQTEGRNRMRMRLIPDRNTASKDYQPKRRQSQGPPRRRSSLSASTYTTSVERAPPLPKQSNAVDSEAGADTKFTSHPPIEPQSAEAEDNDMEDGFEMVNDPRAEAEEYEDKNRKVMRSLQRGDQVQHVHNASRIVGLEAVEGLLILGKCYLYLLDNLFQRMDGEIINASQAPEDERDPYLQVIAGREALDRTSALSKPDYEARSWRWDEVLSISKRRFLFRDVAIEVFFVDGRSYLLTTSNMNLRNELYQKLLSKATATTDHTNTSIGEYNWRIEAIRNPDDETQTLGSKFSSVFAQQASNPATRKWMKGEISNFHYLMLVNTMAGRTFNDLTQYPVFPWVLADYTSDELDLSDPRSFRDLTKPMGCQTFERQAEFKDRYQSFAEMGDEKALPFHYGTHYSSAMIVTSYLIRLQPFVHSYLLLQGGFFDHADRLFYSIERAWASASRDNMTDVRELIPEFYYLPDFLTNLNRYDLGERQSTSGPIDSVALPPWAKGDPKIFIAKHREALESDYVSQYLHGWIDLIFGQKQRGEAAVEATNVFHHLSYHGAKDLDTIDDPVERLATIGIIHNFGQTPHQVFQRAHPLRELEKSKRKNLDSAAENLTRLPFPVLESQDRVTSLHWSARHEKLLPSGPLKINIGPAFDKYMEWGFFDGSVRFYTVDGKKLAGLFEHVHIGQLSTVIFADSKTLITAGSDCTISVWNVVSTPKAIDLQPRKTLFGHTTAISTLAVSRSFGSLLSASSDGQVILWDLNRLALVRILTNSAPTECARINDVTGIIMLCRGFEISLWALNGDPILQQNIYVEGDDTIASCAFYEGNGNEYLERQLIFTGHKRGVVNVWSLAIRDSAFVLEHVKRMHHLDQAGFNIGASITAILPMAQVVYTGDDDGRAYEWDCIQRQ